MSATSSVDDGDDQAWPAVDLEEACRLLGCAGQKATAAQLVVELAGRLDETKGPSFVTDYCQRHGLSPLQPLQCPGGDPFRPSSVTSTISTVFSPPPPSSSGKLFAQGLEGLGILEVLLLPLLASEYRKTPWSALVHSALHVAAARARRGAEGLLRLLGRRVRFGGGGKARRERMLQTLLGHMAALPVSQLSPVDLAAEADFMGVVAAMADTAWVRELLAPHLGPCLLRPLLPLIEDKRVSGLSPLATLIKQYNVPVEKGTSKMLVSRWLLPLYGHLKAWQSIHQPSSSSSSSTPATAAAAAYPRFFSSVRTLCLDN